MIHPPDHSPPANRRRAMLGVAALVGWIPAGGWVLAGLASGTTQAQGIGTPDWGDALPQARPYGHGRFRYFGLVIYDIVLWALPGFDPARYASTPFALELTYARSLAGAAIADRSLSEMRRIAPVDKVQEKVWLDFMVSAFPDVHPSDRLTGIHDGQGGVQFWFNGQLRRQRKDAEFAKLFFGIWLANTTSAPALRQSLIGAARA